MKTRIAYFSMEFAFDGRIPNYAGGLGVLSADVMLSAADLGTPVVGVSLIYHKDDDLRYAFDPSKFLKKRKETVWVEIEGRKVKIAIWQMDVKGKDGRFLPILFLSSNLPENKRWDRDLTKHLYAPDRYTRLGQEIILGIGGARALKAVGFKDIEVYHMNEGHTAFGLFEYLREFPVLTVHTPVRAGREVFDYDLVYQVLGGMVPGNIKELAGEDAMHMTALAMSLARVSNSVSEKHNEICREMYKGWNFENITNGIYHPRWVGAHMETLFDKSLKGWRERPEIFEKCEELLSDDALGATRLKEKKDFVKWLNVNREFFPLEEVRSEDLFEEDVLTIGFARRFVPYKRPALVFKDIKKLAEIGSQKLQLVFSYRCHLNDTFCLETKNFIESCAKELRGKVKVVLVPDYDLGVAKRMVSGCDIWLNTPIPGNEASGTSGMKAALNGVLNLSSPDGWWPEGQGREPLSGWTFDSSNEEDAGGLYATIINAVDCYYKRRGEWVKRMKAAIRLASYFNTHRVVREYLEKMWSL